MRKLVRRSINSTRFEFTMFRTMYGIADPCGYGFFFTNTGRVIGLLCLDYPHIIGSFQVLVKPPLGFLTHTSPGWFRFVTMFLQCFNTFIVSFMVTQLVTITKQNKAAPPGNRCITIFSYHCRCSRQNLNLFHSSSSKLSLA